jgi:uncharacterized protein DUF6498
MKLDPSSTSTLVLINVVTIAIAWWLRWPLVTLLWPYWLQSVIIGGFSFWRILKLGKFSLANTSGFDRGSPEATKRSTARFFAMHYGIFHLVYFFFLASATNGHVHSVPAYHVTELDYIVMAGFAVSFIITHGATYRRIVQADQRGEPNIGYVMFLPYLRIIPMHLSIVIGLSSGHYNAVLLFGALKTAADAAMHWVEYRITGATVESTA